MNQRAILAALVACAALVQASPQPASAAPTWKRWDGMAALRLGEDKVCSGAVVEFPDSKPADKALVLTSGHCIPGPHLKPGAVVTERGIDPKKNTAQLHKGSDDDDHSTPRRVGLDRVVYATMTQSDIAVMRVTVSYADLAKSGIKARKIAGGEAKVGDKVSVPSAQLGQNFGTCTVAAIGQPLKEDAWSWTGLIDIKGDPCQSLREGGSGSPILGEKDGLVYGEVNTIGTRNKATHAFGPSARPLIGCVRQGKYSTQGCTLPKA